MLRAAPRVLTIHRQLDGHGGAREERPVGAQGQLGVAGDVLPVVPGADGQQVADGHAGAAGGGGPEALGAQRLAAPAQGDRQVGQRGRLRHPARQVEALAHGHGGHRLQHHALRHPWGADAEPWGAAGTPPCRHPLVRRPHSR